MGDSTGKNNRGSSSTDGPTSSSPPQWIIDIDNNIKKPPSNSRELCIISRVPPRMRVVDEDSYIPRLVSIGPFHRNNPSLRAMEAHKLRFLYGLLDPMSQRSHTVDNTVKSWRAQNVTLQGLEKEMKELEKKTRECYSDKFDDLKSDEFVRMMLLDGCFVIEFIRWHALTSEEGEKDPIFSSRSMLHDIRQDLLMLENQLPLFLLQRLYTLTCDPDQDKASFNYLAIHVFNLLVAGREIKEIEYKVAGQEHAHILALFQSTFITNTARSQHIEPDWLIGNQVRVPKTWWFSSVMVLRCAGISFKKKMGFFLEIGCENKVLEIPPLVLNKCMVQLLRNAVAYEQCNRSAQPYFTTLVFFFNTLVGSPKEVEFLRKKEIIRTLDSNEKTATVIRNLTRGIAYDLSECCIPEVIEKINKSTASRWTLLKATLNLYYFVNQEPINLLLFYLTIIQTISSLYQIFYQIFS